jgi:hypothetical protein
VVTKSWRTKVVTLVIVLAVFAALALAVAADYVN